VDVRRVVTGHNGQGKAEIVEDTMVQPLRLAMRPGGEVHSLWGSDVVRSFPDDGSRPEVDGSFPPVGGFRWGIFNLVPVGAPLQDLSEEEKAAALAEYEEALPGASQHLEASGMHTTASIDCGIVLSGQAILELDDGAKVTLNPGDTYVQNGTRHRWLCGGDSPAVVAAILIGANHSSA